MKIKKHDISTRLNRLRSSHTLGESKICVDATIEARSEFLLKGNTKKMNLTVKTLKGGKFAVECEPSQTVSEVKAIIVSSVLYHALEDKAFRVESSGFCARSRL